MVSDRHMRRHQIAEGCPECRGDETVPTQEEESDQTVTGLGRPLGTNEPKDPYYDDGKSNRRTGEGACNDANAQRPRIWREQEHDPYERDR